MARGRDLSKSLDEKEVRRLRNLLTQNPQIEEAQDADAIFPKMMFAKGYLDAEREWRENIDPLVKKAQTEKMQRLCRLVWDEEEQSALEFDDWKASPADFLDPSEDPRIPRGSEGRRAALQRRLTLKEELLEARKRLQYLEELEAAMPSEDDAPARVAKPGTKIHLPPAKAKTRQPAHV